MLFKNLFKKKKELSCEEFGKDYLGQWLLTSAKSVLICLMSLALR